MTHRMDFRVASSASYCVTPPPRQTSATVVVILMPSRESLTHYRNSRHLISLVSLLSHLPAEAGGHLRPVPCIFSSLPLSPHPSSSLEVTHVLRHISCLPISWHLLHLDINHSRSVATSGTWSAICHPIQVGFDDLRTVTPSAISLGNYRHHKPACRTLGPLTICCVFQNLVSYLALSLLLLYRVLEILTSCSTIHISLAFCNHYSISWVKAWVHLRTIPS